MGSLATHTPNRRSHWAASPNDLVFARGRLNLHPGSNVTRKNPIAS